MTWPAAPPQPQLAVLAYGPLLGNATADPTAEHGFFDTKRLVDRDLAASAAETLGAWDKWFAAHAIMGNGSAPLRNGSGPLCVEKKKKKEKKKKNRKR
jgi:hypothetical protein